MSVKLRAFKVSNIDGWSIKPASGKRDWMDASREKFAYRCLPLVMANQSGWVLGCPLNFSAVWNGKDDMHATTLTFPEGEGKVVGHIKSHFGHGIITFSLPWLFRTDAGYGLWVRGPANMVKDNIHGLDGIVETDWAPYTFTMNWKIMRRNTPVYFKQGEPICQLVPFPLALLEDVEPEFHSIDSDPLLKQDFFTFTAMRSGNIDKLRSTGESNWAMDYMKGHLPDGTPIEGHRKAFRLKEFEQRNDGSVIAPASTIAINPSGPLEGGCPVHRKPS